MDKEDFYIFPLKHKDVILGASWFDCVSAHMKFLKRKVLFTYRCKDYSLTFNSVGRTILVVALSTFNNVIKNSISCYVVFVKKLEKKVSELNESKSETK